MNKATTISQLYFLDADAATIAPLSRSEADIARGVARRKKMAAVLSAVGKMGVGAATVFVVKSAAVAGATWAAAPAAVTAIALFAAAAATAVMAGTWEYRAQKGDADFSWKDWAHTVNNSKSAKMAFGLALVGGAAFSFLSDIVQGYFGGHTAVLPDTARVSSGLVTEMAPPAVEMPAVDVPAVDAPVAPVPDATPYTVARGETLWELASRLSPEAATPGQIADRVHQIATLNGIADVNHLEAGRTLSFAGIDPAQAAPPAPVIHAPVIDIPAIEAPVVAEQPVLAPASITDADGVRTIVHPSGVVETITSAPAALAVAVDVPAAAAVAQPLPAIGECMVTETESAINIDCKMDPNAVVQPGSGIDFKSAADPQAFRVGLSPNSAPMNAQEFLENHGVPEVQEAFSNGRFSPQP